MCVYFCILGCKYVYFPVSMVTGGVLLFVVVFLTLRLMSLKIAFHIACQRSTSKMVVDRVTLAAVYRLSFERSMSRLSLSLLFSRAFSNSQSS